nr:MFS transporter [Actinopolyspora alba]
MDRARGTALPTLLVSIDVYVLLLALPRLTEDLGASRVGKLWITDIYGFLLAGFLITMGTLGDRTGRKKLLLIGAAAFGAASVVAAYSTSPAMLIAARAVLGVAGAILTPSTISLIRTLFRDPKQMGLAIGLWGTCFSAGAVIGPVIGGAMLTRFWWGSVFCRSAAAARLAPEHRPTGSVTRIVVVNHVTLDGVVQGPGRAEEDTRDGFAHGGWAEANTDDVLLRVWGEAMSGSGGFLLGRRTYEDVLGFWNARESPFREALNSVRKYIASTTLTDPLPWPNSTLLGDDVPVVIAGLREQPGGDLVIMGSGELVRTLEASDLVDRYVLSSHPLVLGSGRRLFPDGFAVTAFELADTTTTGVVIASYARGAR